ncbi:MazG nucleotide pyrophosphohydrolase domain-containing protein [Arthrobacter sp. MDB2-24]
MDAPDPRPSAPGRPPGAAVERLVEVVRLLRRHCPWTAALDHATLLEYLVEETYELYEAVDDVARTDHPGAGLVHALRGELGDVLFQVVLHAQLQTERGSFGLAEVADGLTAKLVRRNPHVFSPDGALRGSFPASVEEIVATWHAVKAQERPGRTSPFEGIPHHLPALALAARTLKRAGEGPGPAAVTQPAMDAVDGADAPRAPDSAAAGGTEGDPDAEARFGRELLELTRCALASGVDPERALRRAVLDYQQDVAGDRGRRDPDADVTTG